MKTERRHALQTNWLADHLGQWLEKVKPYTNRILAGLCVVAAGFLIWQLVGYLGRSSERGAWQGFQDKTSVVTLNRRLQEGTADIDTPFVLADKGKASLPALD